MEIKELEQDPKIVEWFIYVKPKDNTKSTYLSNIRFYCEFLNKSPSELISEADIEAESNVLLKKRKIKTYFTNYINHLNNLNVSANTRRIRLATVKSFYKKNDVELPAIPRNDDVVCLEENIPIPTKEDLQKALYKSHILGKAIILTGISSGLASDDIRKLKVSDFVNGYDPKTQITTLRLRRGKTHVDFVTFLSPEASKAVLEYLDFRNNRIVKREGIKRERQLNNQKVFSNDNYLFINKRVQQSYIESGNDENRKLKRNTFMEIYRAVSDECKLSSPKGKFNIIRSHNLRRYFFSTLTNHGCNAVVVEFLMGHKLSETDSGYYRDNVIDLRNIYQEYIPYLTIQKEFDISESPIFLKMKERNEELEKDNYIKNVERDEIQRMEAKFNGRIEQMDYEMSQIKMKHNLQILKMKQKLEPENKNKIQKMIDTLEDALRKS